MPLILPPPRLPDAFPVLSRDMPVPERLRGGVVAIGNFDGVHLGHKHVVARTRALAREAGRPALVFTFEPHPRSFFRPEPPMFRLCGPEAKLRLLAAEGLDGIAVARFDAAFAALSAEGFVASTLVGWLAASHVVIGRDFHYGAGRKGDVASLVAAGRQAGFAVTQVDARLADGVPVSSSVIRAALASGDVAAANALLGHAWFVSGEVVHGDKRGRTLGYPTANIRLAPGTALRHGIYAVRLGLDGRWHDAVASFGRRPTFDNGAPLLEVHVFDFSESLYGRSVDVAFAAFMRDELKFDTLDALIRQMDGDSAAARAILAAS